MNIFIVGGGNIGQRHIQSTLNLDPSFIINIVEINKTNLHTCKDIVKERENYNFFTSLPTNKIIDLLLISTTSSNRFDIFHKVTKDNKVYNVILEKVVFQVPADYLNCKNIIDNKNIKCWINNWPRTAHYYKEVKQNLDLDRPLSMSVCAHNWNMTCNLSHFIDLFVFLKNSNHIDRIHFKLNHTFKSKRDSFKEFSGSFIINSDKNVLKVIDDKIYGDGIIVEIKQLDKKFKIYEKKFEVCLESKLDVDKVSYFKEPLQSESSYINIKEILKTGSCDLPTYNESYLWHSQMISEINSRIGIDPTEGICPIT
jgi:hypothetical protein